MDGVVVRPLRADETQAAADSAFETFADLDRRTGQQPPEPTDDLRARGAYRVAHLQRTDPDGAWAAELDGRLVGVALALRRGPLWFLSLLTVDPQVQGAGTGRRLLEAALGTAEGAAAGWLVSSEDPRALRRYARAGFDLLPGYDARGVVDRRSLPAGTGVRDAAPADRELVEEVTAAQRGVGHGPDLDALVENGTRLLVLDGPAGRGYAGVSPRGIRPVAGTTTAAAQAVLWAALAETEGQAELAVLTADQQWAVQVAVAAGLALRPGSSSGLRGRPGPLTHYLPSGAYG